MFKNVASQKVTFFAFDYSTGAPKTGDSANITAYVSKDDGAVTVLTDTTATELDSTNAKGLYSFDVSQTETNADKLVFSAKSSTANVSLVPMTIYTAPASFTSFVTPTGAAVNATQFAGQTITAAAGVTLPSSVASPTNITAASGVTVSSVGVGAIATTSFAAGAIDAAAIAASAIGASEIATDAIDADALAADAVTEITTGVFARAFSASYGSLTFDQLCKVAIAVLSGKLSGAATTTVTIRNLADTADVVVATVDANGNRTAVTITP